MREISATQLPIETIVASTDKSDPTLIVQIDIISGENSRVKIPHTISKISKRFISTLSELEELEELEELFMRARSLLLNYLLRP